MFKKVVVPGVLAGLAMVVAGMALSSGFMALLPDLQVEYENTNLFRAPSDPMMMFYFVQPFVTGLVMAWIWEKTKGLFPVDSPVGNGFRFAVIYWVFSLGGMVISYSSFPVSVTMIVTWYLSILFQGILAGVLLTKLNSQKKT